MDDPSEVADRIAALEEAGLTWAIYSFGAWQLDNRGDEGARYGRGRRGSECCLDFTLVACSRYPHPNPLPRRERGCSTLNATVIFKWERY